MDINEQKPAILKGLLWGGFSGTATASAFLLPAFILGNLLYGTSYNYGAIVLIMFCAMYHSVYRVIASDHDLKLVGRLWKYILLLIIITGFVTLFP